MEPLMKHFVGQLVLSVRGSLQAYMTVTQELPEEAKKAAWQNYNRAFEERIMTEILAVLERHGCGIAEICHAALKLLDVGARMVDSVEQQEEESLNETVVPLEAIRRMKKKGRKTRLPGGCKC